MEEVFTAEVAKVAEMEDFYFEFALCVLCALCG
jgi:hypothetical protein